MVDVFSYLSSKHSLLMDRLVEMECVRERPHSPLGEDILSEMLSEDMLCSDQESEDDVPLFNAKGFPTVAGKCPPSQFLVHRGVDMIGSDQESEDDEPLLNAKGFPTVAGKCPRPEFLVSQHPDDDMIGSDQESEDDVPLFNAKGFPTVAGKCPRPEFLVSHQLEVPLLNAKTELLDPETMLRQDFNDKRFGFGKYAKILLQIRQNLPNEYFFSAVSTPESLSEDYVPDKFLLQQDFINGRITGRQYYIRLFKNDPMVVRYQNQLIGDGEMWEYLKSFRLGPSFKIFRSKNPDLPLDIAARVYHPDLYYDCHLGIGFKTYDLDRRVKMVLCEESGKAKRVIAWKDGTERLAFSYTPLTEDPTDILGPLMPNPDIWVPYVPKQVVTANPEPVVTANPEPVVTANPETNDDEAPETNDDKAPETVVTAHPETNDDETPETVVTAHPETNDDLETDDSETIILQKEIKDLLDQHRAKAVKRVRVRASRAKPKAPVVADNLEVPVDAPGVPTEPLDAANALMPMDIDAVDAPGVPTEPIDAANAPGVPTEPIDAAKAPGVPTEPADAADVPRVAVKRPRVRASRAKPKAPVVPEPFVGDGPVAYFSVDDEPIADLLEPIVPEPVADALVLQQAIVRTYTTKEQRNEEAKIPKNKSYSEWLPLQRYPRVLQQVNETYATKTDLHEMAIGDLYALGNSTEVAISRSSNAIIRYNIMKGQVIEELVIRAKQKSSRSKIGDVYTEVNASLQRYAMEHGSYFFEIQARRMQELRALGDAAEYLELDKYDYKCTTKELIDRAPQIVKEAKSLNPLVEKRPLVPAAKRQRVE